MAGAWQIVWNFAGNQLSLGFGRFTGIRATKLRLICLAGALQRVRNQSRKGPEYSWEVPGPVGTIK